MLEKLMHENCMCFPGLDGLAAPLDPPA